MKTFDPLMPFEFRPDRQNNVDTTGKFKGD